MNGTPITKADLDSFAEGLKTDLEKDLRTFIVERENALLKWVVTVQLGFFAIQITTLLGTAGLILGGVYYMLTHFNKI